MMAPGSGLSESRLPWRQVRTSEQSVGLALMVPLDFPTLPLSSGPAGQVFLSPPG